MQTFSSAIKKFIELTFSNAIHGTAKFGVRGSVAVRGMYGIGTGVSLWHIVDKLCTDKSISSFSYGFFRVKVFIITVLG